MKKKIFPSLISADQMNLESIIEQLDPHVDGFHIDLMDNHFVPNLTWGPAMANAVGTITSKPRWIHLMTMSPETIIEILEIRENDIISFHIEATQQPHAIVKLLNSTPCVASIALKPSTALHVLEPFLSSIGHVNLMSVEPGFSGQTFLPQSLDRLIQLKDMCTQYAINLTIGMDGGINQKNINLMHEHGVTDFAIASAIFGPPSDPVKNIKKLYDA